MKGPSKLIRPVNDQFAPFRGGYKYSKKKSKSKSKSKKGAGFGMPKNPDTSLGFSYPQMERVTTCKHVASPEKLGAGQPKMHQGGKKSILEAKPNGDGLSSYGFAGDKDGLSQFGSYAPITKYTRKACGGKKHKKSNKIKKIKKNKTAKRKHMKKSKKMMKLKSKYTMRKSKKGKKSKKGGNSWPTNWGNVPNTPGLSLPQPVKPTESYLANPPSYKGNNVLGTDTCKDNYNHYTGKGFRTPIFNKDAPVKNHM